MINNHSLSGTIAGIVSTPTFIIIYDIFISDIAFSFLESLWLRFARLIPNRR